MSRIYEEELTKYTLIIDGKEIKPSREQIKIIRKVKEGKNIIVDAVAGSGKTMVILMIAKSCPEKKILQITYNSLLKIEVRQKKKKLRLNNLRVHSYHSLYHNFYGTTLDDEMMNQFIQDDIALKKTISPYDIIIIDEIQDMTPLYFEGIMKFIKDLVINNKSYYNNKKGLQLCLIGDEFQSIYDFKDADPRYLTLATYIWELPFLKSNFIELTLNTSFRLTKQISFFINEFMLSNRKIKTRKYGPKVEYLICNSFNPKFIFDRIEKDLINGSIKPDDIFILSPSIKSVKSPIRKLENYIVNSSEENRFGKKILVYCSFDEERKLNDEIIKGKIVFSTIHQSKGRERPIVILFNFDDAFFDFFCPDKPRDVCPSELYVGCTRASKKLILVHHSSNPPLTFFKKDITMIKETKQIRLVEDKKESSLKKSKSINKNIKNKSKNVRDLTKYLNLRIIIKLKDALKKISKKINDMSEDLAIPSTVKTKFGSLEEVADINGIVIPALYEKKNSKDKEATIIKHLMTVRTSLDEQIGKKNKISKQNKKQKRKKTTLFDENNVNYFDNLEIIEIAKNIDSKKISKFLQDAIYSLPDNINSIKDFLHAGVIYSSFLSGFYNKIAQINDFDWLTQDMVEVCHKNMKKFVKDNASYEIPIQYIYNSIYGTILITGIIDCDDGDTIWEFKCVEKLQLEHKLQLAIYAFIWHKTKEEKEGPRNFKLINIRTSEIWELNLNTKNNWNVLNSIIDILVEKQFMGNVAISDNEFIEQCSKIKSKYF